MAYVYQKKDEQQNLGGQSQGGGQNLVSDTDSGSISGSASSSAAPGDAGGSGWTNLQSYVDANKGESERTANRIVGDVKKQREDTTKTVQDFGSTNISGYEKADDTFLDDLRQGRSNQQAREGQSIDKLYDTGYSGPENTSKVEGYDTTLGAVQDFGRTSDALSDPNKIAEQYTPGASIGEKSLDSFFYQQKPAQQIFQKEVDAGGAVDDLWSQTQQDLGGRISAERAGYDAQQQNIRDAFNQGLSGYESQFNPNMNQGHVDQQNAARQQQYQDFLAGAGRGGRVGDFESQFGDQIGYDWERMFDYGGDTSLGDYAGNTESIGDYRDFLGQYGDAFGAKDMFGGADIQRSGRLGTNAAGTADASQKSALAELGALYNQNPGQLQGNERWDQLLATLGVQGFVDERQAPADPNRIQTKPIGSGTSRYEDPIENIPRSGELEEFFGDVGEDIKGAGGQFSEGVKKNFGF